MMRPANRHKSKLKEHNFLPSYFYPPFVFDPVFSNCMHLVDLYGLFRFGTHSPISRSRLLSLPPFPLLFDQRTSIVFTLCIYTHKFIYCRPASVHTSTANPFALTLHLLTRASSF